MSECKQYAHSLINNLSLLSNLVLVPNDNDINNICFHLNQLKNKGLIRFTDNSMRKLINGTPSLNNSNHFAELKRLINNIDIKSNS